MSAPRSDGRPGFWSGMVIGGAIGTAVGLLLAPRPGAETREQLLGATGAWRSRADTLMAQGLDEQMATLRETFEEVREILREAVAEGREVLREAIEEGRQASARTAEELRHRYQQATGRESEEEQPS
ncbi:MAG: YtxH domain-containing protein [Chloroflexi bacterium]|nr:YtxH domain-containing protein [Chloroflexota bacterium]